MAAWDRDFRSFVWSEQEFFKRGQNTFNTITLPRIWHEWVHTFLKQISFAYICTLQSEIEEGRLEDPKKMGSNSGKKIGMGAEGAELTWMSDGSVAYKYKRKKSVLNICSKLNFGTKNKFGN